MPARPPCRTHRRLPAAPAPPPASPSAVSHGSATPGLVLEASTSARVRARWAGSGSVSRNAAWEPLPVARRGVCVRACVRASEVEVSEGGLWPTWPAEAPKVSTRWSQLTNSAPASERGEPGRCSGQARPRGLTAPGPGARVGGGQAHGRSAEGRYPAGTCSVCLSWFPFLFCSVYGFLLITAIAIVDFLTILVPLPPAPGRLVKKRGRGPRRGTGARRVGAPSGGAAVGVSGALRWACPMSCDGRARSLMVGVSGACGGRFQRP